MTKSIVISSQVIYSGGSGMLAPCRAGRGALNWWDTSQPATYLCTVVFNPSKWKSQDMSSALLRAPK